MLTPKEVELIDVSAGIHRMAIQGPEVGQSFNDHQASACL